MSLSTLIHIRNSVPVIILLGTLLPDWAISRPSDFSYSETTTSSAPDGERKREIHGGGGTETMGTLVDQVSRQRHLLISNQNVSIPACHLGILITIPITHPPTELCHIHHHGNRTQNGFTKPKPVRSTPYTQTPPGWISRANLVRCWARV